MCRSGVNSEVQVEVSSGVNASAASAIMIMCLSLRLRHGVTLGGGRNLEYIRIPGSMGEGVLKSVKKKGMI